MARTETAQHFAHIGAERSKLFECLGVGCAGADHDLPAAFTNGIETCRPACMNDLRQMPHLLGNPQPHIGGTGKDHRIGVRRTQCGKRPDRSGRCKEALLRPGKQIIALHGKKSLFGLLPAFYQRVLRRSAGCFQRGFGNRPVAGAAAQIARQPVIDRAPFGLFTAVMQGKKTHHKARRAEAALRTVQIDHRLLHRMQFAALGEVVDGNDIATIHLAKHQDAGIDRFIGEPAVSDFPKRHGAGATIALVAAFLGTRLAFGKPQMIEQRRCRIEIRHRCQLAVAQELEPVAHETSRHLVTGTVASFGRL